MSFFDKLLDDISEESINTLHKSVKFVAGESEVPVTGKVFGKEEIKNAIKASAEFIALREEVLKIIFADEAGALDE